MIKVHQMKAPILIVSPPSHHCKAHTRPFKCSTCLSRHTTKRQVDRHVNDYHDQKERYFCTVFTCKRSMTGRSKPFSREDNCRKHMRRAHRFTDDQARTCYMDELTKNIRRKRKFGKMGKELGN